MSDLMIVLLLTVGLATAPAWAQPTSQPGEAPPDFDKLWDYNAPDHTEVTFRELLPRFESSGDAGRYVELLTQIARAEGLQRKFDAAHKTLDGAEKLIKPAMTTARVRLLLERGRVFNSSQQVDKARPLFEQAYKLARRSRLDFHAVDAAHMLGICEKGEEALKWNEKSIRLAEKSKDPRARDWLGSLYNNIGWTYHDMGKHRRALGLFEKALKWRQEKKDEKGTRIAKWCVARAKRSLGQTEEALAMQQALLKEHEAADSKDGYVYEEIAECLLALKRPDEARPHFTKAYELLSADPWLKANEAERMERLKKLAEK